MQHSQRFYALLLAAVLTVATVASISAAPPSPTPAPTQSATAPPYDPFEPILTQPQSLTRQDHDAATKLLTKGLQNNLASAYLFSNFPIPYEAKISFTSLGQSQYVGPGEMDSSQNAAHARRWTFRLAGFQMSRILTPGTPALSDNNDKLSEAASSAHVYDQGWSAPIPMRAQMIRADVLDVPRTGGKLRTAAANINGTPVTCILVSSLGDSAAYRDWYEAEYCVEPRSGLLRLYSGAPGSYYLYDYEDAQSFHGRVVPSTFTVAEAGQIILQGKISVADPTTEELAPTLFTPTPEMYSKGVYCDFPTYGHTLYRPATATSSRANSQPTPPQQNLLPQNQQPQNAPPQKIVVHAILAPDGKVIDATALQYPDTEIGQSAVALVEQTKFDPAPPVTNPQQREIFVFVQ